MKETLYCNHAHWYYWIYIGNRAKYRVLGVKSATWINSSVE